MRLPPEMQNYNFKRITIISICALLFGITFGCFLFPVLLKKMITSHVNLKPNTELREMYTKVPFYLDFRLYIFNLTNPGEVQKGGKPKLQEIGPYFFEEWKEKWDLVDDATDDTLTYHFKNTFIFRKDLSGPGLTGDEIITTIHPLIFPMAMAVNVDKKPMLPVVKNALNAIFHDPPHPFWTGRVMDLLYDGVPIDCSSDTFEAKAVCSVFESGEVKAVRQIDDTTFKFSFFAGANGTDLGEFKVFRGIKKYADVGRVVSFNGEEEMDYWEGDECNQYVGTDSTIFPSFMKKEDGLFAYEPSICRSLGAHYIKPSKYMGIPTLEYGIDMGSPQNDKECFCRDPPDGCPKKGTFDLFRCVGAPLFGSLPHFYNADPELLSKFASGLNPKKEDHDIYLHFEIMTGSPLSAAKRLQFNLEVVPIPEIEILSEIQPMLYPLFWVEESAHLNATFVNVLKHTLFRMIKIVNVIKWMCIVLGLIGTIVGVYCFQLKFKTDQMTVTAVAPGNNLKETLNGIRKSAFVSGEKEASVEKASVEKASVEKA